MNNNHSSTKLCKAGNNNLSKWDEAVSAAKSQILELKRSIQIFQEMKAKGAIFPEPKPASNKRKARRIEVGT